MQAASSTGPPWVPSIGRRAPVSAAALSRWSSRSSACRRHPCSSARTSLGISPPRWDPARLRGTPTATPTATWTASGWPRTASRAARASLGRARRARRRPWAGPLRLGRRRSAEPPLALPVRWVSPPRSSSCRARGPGQRLGPPQRPRLPRRRPPRGQWRGPPRGRAGRQDTFPSLALRAAHLLQRLASGEASEPPRGAARRRIGVRRPHLGRPPPRLVLARRGGLAAVSAAVRVLLRRRPRASPRRSRPRWRPRTTCGGLCGPRYPGLDSAGHANHGGERHGIYEWPLPERAWGLCIARMYVRMDVSEYTQSLY